MDFEQIYTPANRRQVLNVCRRILRSMEDAEDASQEAFFNAFRKLHTYDGTSALTTWLHSIARNAARNLLRSRPENITGSNGTVIRTVEVVSLSKIVSHHDQGGAQDGYTLGDLLPAPGLSPEDLLFFQEIMQSLATMPAEWRDPMYMMLEGHSYEEIGMAMVLSVGAIKSRIWGTRRRLRRAIGNRQQATGNR